MLGFMRLIRSAVLLFGSLACHDFPNDEQPQTIELNVPKIRKDHD